ncbi:MAG TPA: RidA family protein, partial [Pirellulaceae bacterium]|nr:RidA family protein [Pirellulaceae bacterium]
ERLGAGPRWSDVVIHAGVARWVEVADDPTLDAREQIRQVLAQIDGTLTSFGSQRSRLLQVVIYLADLADAAVLNEQWDAWIIAGQAPSRACVQAGLSGNYRIEMVLTAAVD